MTALEAAALLGTASRELAEAIDALKTKRNRRDRLDQLAVIDRLRATRDDISRSYRASLHAAELALSDRTATQLEQLRRRAQLASGEVEVAHD